MPYLAPYIDAEGLHVPDYADIRDYLISEYGRIFGADAYLGEESLDYQLISVFARCLSDFTELVRDLYNSRNPNYATGDSLDLLLPLNGIRRNAATYSTVSLTITGTAGTVVPAGSQAIDENGNLWALDEDCELNEEGNGTVLATCETAGPISAPAGTINDVYSADYDWEVTNLADATIGGAAESDEAVRIRRSLMVTQGNNGSYESMVQALQLIDGVDSVNVFVNDTDTVDGTTQQTPHSVCAVVHSSFEGETELAEFRKKAAETIWRHKAPGIGTFGNTTASYVDDYGHSYSVNFEIPTKKLVTVNVTLSTLATYDAVRVEPIIKSAILNGVNGLGVGKQWNVTMAYKDIYGAFSNETCPFIVTGIEGTKEGGSAQAAIVPCSFNEILYTDADHINFILNQ